MNNAIEKQLKIKYNKKREQALAQAKANFSVAMKNKDFAQTFQTIRNLDLDISKKILRVSKNLIINKE